MVALFKQALIGVIEGTNLSIDAFHTYACAAEHVVNSCPLTPVSVDSRDLDALSPLNFLFPGALATSALDVLPIAPPGCYQRLATSFLKICHLLDSFWLRWRREYISLLQGRSKWSSRQRNLQQGDVVLVVDKQMPRDQWPLGAVMEVIKGEDGLVRRVLVRLAESAGLDRHVTGVVLLEAAGETGDAAFKAVSGSGGTGGPLVDCGKMEESCSNVFAQKIKVSTVEDEVVVNPLPVPNVSVDLPKRDVNKICETVQNTISHSSPSTASYPSPDTVTFNSASMSSTPTSIDEAKPHRIQPPRTAKTAAADYRKKTASRAAPHTLGQ